MNNVFGHAKTKLSIQCGQMYIARYFLFVRSYAAIFFRTQVKHLKILIKSNFISSSFSICFLDVGGKVNT